MNTIKRFFAIMVITALCLSGAVLAEEATEITAHDFLGEWVNQDGTANIDIEAHDDENKTVMNQYEVLAGLKEDEGGKLARVSFFELKKWFLNTYPELEEQVVEARKHSNELLAKAAENAKNYKNKKKIA